MKRKPLRRVEYIAQVIYRRPLPSCNWNPKDILLYDAVSGEAINTDDILPSEYSPEIGEWLMAELFQRHRIDIKSANLFVMPAMYLEPKEFKRLSNRGKK